MRPSAMLAIVGIALSACGDRAGSDHVAGPGNYRAAYKRHPTDDHPTDDHDAGTRRKYH
ncbi:MAG: hypothetical protein V3R84_01750 [Acidimicrobiia bacterium]